MNNQQKKIYSKTITWIRRKVWNSILVQKGRHITFLEVSFSSENQKPWLNFENNPEKRFRLSSEQARRFIKMTSGQNFET